MAFLKSPQQGNAAQVIQDELTENYIATNGAQIGKAYVADPLNIGQVVEADNTNPSHKNKFKGIAQNTVGAGQVVTLRHGGEFQSASLGLTNLGGPIFYNDSGEIIDVAPSSGDHIQIIGKVLKSDRIEVNPDSATAI